MAETLKVPPDSHFFLKPSFQNLGLNVVPPSRKGRTDAVYASYNIYTYISIYLSIYLSIYIHTLFFLTQIISRRQINADAKVALSISRRQKWNSHRQFSRKIIFPNIHLNAVVNRLTPFKKLSDHTNRFLMG